MRRGKPKAGIMGGGGSRAVCPRETPCASRLPLPRTCRRRRPPPALASPPFLRHQPNEKKNELISSTPARSRFEEQARGARSSGAKRIVRPRRPPASGSRGPGRKGAVERERGPPRAAALTYLGLLAGREARTTRARACMIGSRW